ncbi:MAG: prepilin-type N-terminal cleavage/methylation domain-containing protein, partial [Thermoguttaceae bacterium]|nr:prepilin-type N-terminal cleavage/methylation domain-containing protein [Thermoguttaceae bacterium]
MRKTFTAQAGRIPRHGFTLVEILGAILIISILAA